MIVYKATNTNNGKVYIGKTVRGLSHAKARHFQRARYQWKYGTDSHFYNAIRKNGEDAFTWEVVYQGSSDADIQAREREYIALYSSKPEGVYNMTPGGDGGAGKTLSDGHKAKMSKAFSGEGNPQFGKHGADHPSYGHKKSEEVKERIRLAHKGKPKSEEHRAKLSASRIAKSHFTPEQREEAVHLAAEEEYSVPRLAKRYGVSSKVIRSVLHERLAAPKYNEISKRGQIEQGARRRGSTVSEEAKAKHSATKLAKSRYTPEMRAEMIRLVVEEGWKQNAVAKKFNATKAFVSRLMAQARGNSPKPSL